MPFQKGYSKKVISKNIQKEMHTGKLHKQAVAIAMSAARKSGCPTCGKIGTHGHRY